MHVYQIRPRSDKRGVDLISDALPFVVSGIPSQTQSAIQSATQSFFSCSHDAVIRVFDETGNVIKTREHTADFKEW